MLRNMQSCIMVTGPQVESAYCVTVAFAYNGEATAFSLRGMGFLLGGKENVAYGDNHTTL